MFHPPLNFDKWYSVLDINGFAPPSFLLHPPFISKYALVPPVKQDPEYSPDWYPNKPVKTSYTAPGLETTD